MEAIVKQVPRPGHRECGMVTMMNVKMSMLAQVPRLLLVSMQVQRPRHFQPYRIMGQNSLHLL
jgi:hypothetical protein